MGFIYEFEDGVQHCIGASRRITIPRMSSRECISFTRTTELDFTYHVREVVTYVADTGYNIG